MTRTLKNIVDRGNAVISEHLLKGGSLPRGFDVKEQMIGNLTLIVHALLERVEKLENRAH